MNPKIIAKLLLIFILVVFTNVCCGQKTANVKVEYDVEFNFDFPVKASAVLFCNDSISQYLVYDRENVASKHNLDVMFELNGTKKLEILETNISANKIKFIKNFLDDTFLVVENRKPIDWKITSEKKMIGKFECLKAVGEFRNRTYIVYFCPTIQSQFGPWKLNGLPGLILEAQESNNLLRIFVKQVDVAQSTFSFFNFDYSLKSISLKEYVKLTDNLPNMIAEQVNLKLPRGVRLEGVTGVENQNKIEIFDETDF